MMRSFFIICKFHHNNRLEKNGDSPIGKFKDDKLFTIHLTLSRTRAWTMTSSEKVMKFAISKAILKINKLYVLSWMLFQIPIRARVFTLLLYRAFTMRYMFLQGIREPNMKHFLKKFVKLYTVLTILENIVEIQTYSHAESQFCHSISRIPWFCTFKKLTKL